MARDILSDSKIKGARKQSSVFRRENPYEIYSGLTVMPMKLRNIKLLHNEENDAKLYKYVKDYSFVFISYK